MSKPITRSDKTIRPFKTFKNWSITTTGSNDPFHLCLDSRELPLSEIKVLEGISSSGIFYPLSNSRYDASSNPVNFDGSYKSVIYSTYNHLFYRDALTNPINTFGVEYADVSVDGKYENRNINNRIVVAKIPQTVFGEKIRPLSVNIYDESNPHVRYHIQDDGYTNLILQGSEFSTVQELDVVGIHIPKEYYVYDPSNDRFGRSVSAWKEYIVVGCPMDENSFSDAKSGASYLYKFDVETSTYRFVRELFSPFTQNGLVSELYFDNENLLLSELGVYLLANGYSLDDRFGQDVSINENFMAIGSPRTDLCAAPSKRGAVYVYDKYKGGADHWGIINLIEGPATSSASGSSEDFGFSVSITTSSLAVGSPGAYDQKGAVYIFNRKKYANDYTGSFWWQAFEEECSQIIMEDESLLFDERDIPYFVSGNNTFEYAQILTASDGVAGDRFGACLQLSASRLIVGHDNPLNSGSVYLFENVGTGSWSQSAKFTCPPSMSSNLVSFFDTSKVFVTHSILGFGTSVSIDQDYILIGSPSDEWYYEYSGSSTLYKEGAVYVYQLTASSWTVVDKLVAPETNSEQNSFGSSVDVKVPYFAIGSLIGKQSFSASYTTKYLVEDSDMGATGSLEDSYVAGRASFYKLTNYSPTGSYTGSTVLKSVKRNKLKNRVKQDFGFDVAVTDKIAVVGSPSFLTTGSSTISGAFSDQNILRDEFSSSYHGSAYVYTFDDLNKTWQIGNVFYKNGILINTATQSQFQNIMNTTSSEFGFDLKFQGTHTIYENEVMCSIQPGEFNVSTNPSSVVRSRILFDINGDGFFDENDLDIIMRYLVEYSKNEPVADEHGIRQEADADWWNNQVIITESEDVLFVNSLPQVTLTKEERIMQNQNIDQKTIDYLSYLLEQDSFDINGDGIVDLIDAKILFNYFLGRTGYDILRNAKTTTSQRTPSEIIDFLNEATGKNNGIFIKGDFLNYSESSSLDKTGSYLSPYISTIGLYDNDQLVAVAKLGKPIKNLIDYPINFCVRWDT